MRFLIDGYNLLFALGKLTSRSGKEALGPARKWLLALIRSGHDADVTVVFDGRPGRGAAEAGAVYSQGETADDVIEESAIEFEGEDVSEEDIVDEFKKFLDRVSAEDFAEAESEIEAEEEDDD